MKKIISVLIVLSVLLFTVSCGEVETYADVAKLIEKEAKSFNSFNEEKIDEWESLYGGATEQFKDSILNMCYATMEDGTRVRCIEFQMDVYASIYSNKLVDSKVLIFNDTIVLHGNADIIDTIAEYDAE